MTDQVFIYVIVSFNAFCQIMLIWRQKFVSTLKWKFCCAAIAIPLALMLLMRLLIEGGMIHGNVADQPLLERYITHGASMLLIAGPWLVTLAAILTRIRHQAMSPSQTVGDTCTDDAPCLPSKPVP